MRFSYTIVHVPGKSLCTPDTLSRSLANRTSCSDSKFQQEVDAYVKQDEDPVAVKSLKCTVEKGGQTNPLLKDHSSYI